MPSFMGRECIITAMPAEVHYDGGSEADRKRIPAVRQQRKKDAVDCTAGGNATGVTFLLAALGPKQLGLLAGTRSCREANWAVGKS
jgi:hypothetical protein